MKGYNVVITRMCCIDNNQVIKLHVFFTFQICYLDNVIQ